MLAQQIKEARLPEPARNLRYHPMRPWTFDLCWPARGIAAQVETGADRHTRTACNQAARWGWLVFRFTPEMVQSGEAVETLEAVWRAR